MTAALPAGRISPALRVAIGLPVLLGALDLTVISATLPVIIDELRLPLPDGTRQAAWLVSGYLIAYAIGILGAGRLGDAIGERRVLIGATILFGLASALVAISGDWSTELVQQVTYRWFESRPGPDTAGVWTLVAARALQALGAGAMVPVGMSYGWKITGSRAWLGFIAAADMLGWTLGHLYGGIVVSLANWRTAFWINVPLCGLSLFLLYRTKHGETSNASRFPLVQFLLGGAGLSILVFGTAGESDGRTVLWGWVVAGIVLVASSVALGADRLLPLHAVWRDPAATAINFLLGYLVFLTLAFVPLYVSVLFEQEARTDAWITGWLLSAFTLPLVLATWLGTRDLPKWLLLLGAAGSGVGFLMVRGWEPNVAALIPALVIIGMSLGFFFTPMAERVLATAPPETAGGASSLVILTRLIGMAVGTSILTGFILARVGAANIADAASLLKDVESAFEDAAYLGAFGSAVLASLVGVSLASSRNSER